MRTEDPRAIRLADYQAPAFRIVTVTLGFALDPEATRVTAHLEIVRKAPGPLVLDGEAMTLVSLALDGRALGESEYRFDGRQLTIDMGHVSFDSARIPVVGAPREVIKEKISILDREFVFTAATIGNPHCVIPLPAVTPELAHKYGPHLETHANFPKKTNVQFLQVIDRANIRIEIWERGAGYTLASGSSSSASAAVAHKLGLVDRKVTVHMPGGQIGIEIGDNFAIRMTGPVTRVAEGTLYPELFTTKV